MENSNHHQQLQAWSPVTPATMAANQDLTPTTLMPEPDEPDSYPPGFRFIPEDEELVSHYLVKCIPNHQPSVPSPSRHRKHIIPQVDIYQYDSPEDLKEHYPLGAVNKKDEWYFVTQLLKKYPNGVRPSRVCGDHSISGYWKPTGKDKIIDVVSVTAKKKSLEYFRGKPPGKKTDWKMHEYKIYKVNGNLASELMYPVICKIYLNTRKKDNKKDDDQGEAAAEEETLEEVHGGEKGSDQSQTASINSAPEGDGGANGGANVNPPLVDDPGTNHPQVAPAVDQNVQSNYNYQQFDPASPFNMDDAYNQDFMNPFNFDEGAAWYDVNLQQTPDYYSFPYDHPGPGLY